MYEQFGAAEISNTGVAQFKLFIPDASLDPSQYTGGGLPRIKRIKAIGDFQAKKWDPKTGVELKKAKFENRGWLYSGKSKKLKKGFYEYKYHVEFENGEIRTVGDPCTKYGGSTDQNAGFVIDMHAPLKVKPLKGGRKTLKDLVIYELMIDDFTFGYRKNRAPLDALKDKVQHLIDLGINAVELMPWTAWPSNDFGWGYNPYAYFSVAFAYTLNPKDATNKLVYLKQFINLCHEKGIAVFMDGVFNHVDPGDELRCNGFAYYHLYQQRADCPFVGNFEAADYGKDLDYKNGCTLQFALDICKYWIDEFKIDGVRFDNTKGFYRPGDRGVGLAKLLSSLRDHLAPQGTDGQNFMTALEHSWDYDAIDVVNKVGATSCWYDPSRSIARDMLKWRYIGRHIMRMLNASRDFAPGHVATAYIENHDHETIMQNAGSRDWWYMTQPWMIALFTMPAAPMIHNGQEWGQMYWFPEPGESERDEPRVKSRPLTWDLKDDENGKALMKRYKQLIKLRHDHPGLRDRGFYPADWQSGVLDHEGHGVDEHRKLVVYTRFGSDGNGKTEYFVVALNFSDNQEMVVPKFPLNGRWKDLLSGEQIDVTDGRFGFNVSGNWGRVYYLRK